MAGVGENLQWVQSMMTPLAIQFASTELGISAEDEGQRHKFRRSRYGRVAVRVGDWDARLSAGVLPLSWVSIWLWLFSIS